MGKTLKKLRKGVAGDRNSAPGGARRGNLFSEFLSRDPVPWLLAANDPAVNLMVRRDLWGEKPDFREFCSLPDAQRIVRRQQPDGSWLYPARKPPPQNFDLYQTFLNLGELVGKYGFDRRHPAVGKAARYVFSCQTTAGDFRGIYGSQPAHTYTPALMAVLTDAGYGNAPEIGQAFAWLLATRQDDGGWAIPTRTRDLRLVRDWDRIASGPEIEADPSRPFSHMVTGMVLRAFAAHPRHRKTTDATRAAALLKSRLFAADKYPDRKGPEYWTKFTYPFQFTDLLSALDSLGRMGFPAGDPDVSRAIDWFRRMQHADGSFELNMCRGTSDKRLPLWIGLALCRALLRFGPNG